MVIVLVIVVVKGVVATATRHDLFCEDLEVLWKSECAVLANSFYVHSESPPARLWQR